MRIRDSGAFLTPGSGMSKRSGSGSGIRIRDEQPESYFRELRDHFFAVKYLHSLMRIRDGKNRFGSGIKKKLGSGINIPDPQHWCSESSVNPTCQEAEPWELGVMVEDKLGEGSALPVIRVCEQAHPLLLPTLYHTIANSLQQKQHNNIPGTKHVCKTSDWGLFSQD